MVVVVVPRWCLNWPNCYFTLIFSALVSHLVVLRD